MRRILSAVVLVLILSSAGRCAQESRSWYSAPGVQETKLAMDRNGSLIVNVWINEIIPLTLIVDTGATEVYLTAQAGEKLFSTGALPRSPRITPVIAVLADGRKAAESAIMIKSIRLGDMVARNVEASISLAKEPVVSKYDGLLGMSFLKQFKFGIDYQKSTLTLEKTK